MVSDDSGSENITVFDRDAFNYIGMTANVIAAEKLKMGAYSDGWPEKIDCFIGKKFVFKVGIKISEWNSYTSLIVQRMTNEPVILDKFSGYRLAQVTRVMLEIRNFVLLINLTSNFEDLSTPTKNKSKQLLNVGGQRLSFTDAEAPASIETLVTGKRSATVLCDNGQSSEDFVLISEATNKKNKM
ncbi:uncharacterized protein G2W53_010204 [Senna tora]|uniref:Uncharacterized protein n=1 Tax=Senna tora TaxID=362788 RepID=A0A834X091_9FABA|nr:uncharacterized protein G2W53_010204 [Senna tora]